MTVTYENFPRFVRERGREPTPGQWLLEFVCHRGRWPDEIVFQQQLIDPGVLIETHVFAVALQTSGQLTGIPRRLALIAATPERRALLRERADELTRELAAAAASSVLGHVAETLKQLRSPVPQATNPSTPLLVNGVEEFDQRIGAWAEEPSACAVLCCSPRAFGSRLLWHGDGLDSTDRPREAGLLAYDTACMIDGDPALHRQLLTTTRRVAHFVADKPSLGVPGLQTVQLGMWPDPAVPDSARLVATADHAQTGGDVLQTQPVQDWPPAARGTARTRGVRAIADVIAARTAETCGPVLCWLNSPDDTDDLRTKLTRRDLAVAVLEECEPDGAGAVQVLMTAQPPDAEVSEQIATYRGNRHHDTRIQMVISELAPGDVLVRRAWCLPVRSSITVLVPEGTVSRSSGPYEPVELQQTHKWLADLPNLAMPTVAAHPPPARPRRRRLYQRLESSDAYLLARTTSAPADRSVGLWLSEQISASPPNIGLVLRASIPADDTLAEDLLRAAPVAAHEVRPLPLTAGVRQVVQSMMPNSRTDETTPRILLVRAREVSVLPHASHLASGDH